MVQMSELRPVRVKFAKRGQLIYISHLDLNRTFSRAFQRAGLPLWYSEGFNPHPRFNFALPLSVGVASDCEFLDMKFVSPMSDEEAAARLSAALPAELPVLEVYTPETKFKEITDADYRIEITSDRVAPDCEKFARAALAASPLVVRKRTKSGERDTDIAPYLRGAEITCASGKMTAVCRLCADSANYLNPEYIVRVLADALALCLRDDPRSQVDITRTGVFLGGGAAFR